MRSLYISEQGCSVSLNQEWVMIRQGETMLNQVQLPLLEQILVFGRSQLTTPLIQACLHRDIPIAYLSRMGFCYGRIIPIERGYRQLSRYQQQLSSVERLIVAQQIIRAKLRNSRVLLQRQQRRRGSELLETALQNLEHLANQALEADTTERLMGLEGAGAACYFSAFGECFDSTDFVFTGRSRRPPGNPVNAILSFGYQLLWNHLLSLIEIQGLDPYEACLHQGTARHAALASDLLEEFRAAIIDSLALYVANRRILNSEEDFEHRDGGCYLNDSGRKKFLKAFLQRMEEPLQAPDGEPQPRWDLLTQQVKAFKHYVYARSAGYHPYLIR